MHFRVFLTEFPSSLWSIITLFTAFRYSSLPLLWFHTCPASTITYLLIILLVPRGYFDLPSVRMYNPSCRLPGTMVPDIMVFDDPQLHGMVETGPFVDATSVLAVTTRINRIRVRRVWRETLMTYQSSSRCIRLKFPLCYENIHAIVQILRLTSPFHSLYELFSTAST